MPISFGLLIVGLSLVAAKVLDLYVSRHRTCCTEMLGMMVGMVGGMMTGLVIGEVAGFFTDMFKGNLIGLLLAVPLGAYLGRHGHLIGMLDGAMAGVMGGMMGAMLGVMLKFPPEHALATGILLLVAQLLALASVAYLLKRTCALPASLPDYYETLEISKEATPREVAAAYLRVTTPTAPVSSPERLRRADEALAVLSDPFRRLSYDRALATEGAASTVTVSKDEARCSATPLGRSKAFGTLALIGAAIVGFSYLSNRPVVCPPPAAAAGLPALSEPGDPQKQVVNLTIQYPCYYPDRIMVQRGVPVELNIGAVGEPGCGRQLVVRGLGLSAIVAPGRITTLAFTPEQTGTYSINCGMNMMKPAMLSVVE